MLLDWRRRFFFCSITSLKQGQGGNFKTDPDWDITLLTLSSLSSQRTFPPLYSSTIFQYSDITLLTSSSLSSQGTFLPFLPFHNIPQGQNISRHIFHTGSVTYHPRPAVLQCVSATNRLSRDVYSQDGRTYTSPRGRHLFFVGRAGNFSIRLVLVRRRFLKWQTPDLWNNQLVCNDRLMLSI